MRFPTFLLSTMLVLGVFGAQSQNTPATTKPVILGRTLRPTVTGLSPSVPGAQLSGPYAFRFSGRSSLSGTPTDVAIVGSLTADGKGNLSGIEDVNSGAGAIQSLKFTGTFGLNQSNIGVMTLTTSLGSQSFALYLPATQLSGATTYATFIETDGYVDGSGVLSQAILPNSIGSFYGAGTYALEGDGVTACTDCTALGHAAGTVLLAGQFTLGSQGAITGVLSESIGPQPGSVLPVSGSATAADANGRMTFTTATGQNSADQPTHFVGYFVDSYHFYFLSADPHTTSILLSGSAQQRRAP